jgi:hypothetical protein
LRSAFSALNRCGDSHGGEPLVGWVYSVRKATARENDQKNEKKARDIAVDLPYKVALPERDCHDAIGGL